MCLYNNNLSTWKRKENVATWPKKNILLSLLATLHHCPLSKCPKKEQKYDKIYFECSHWMNCPKNNENIYPKSFLCQIRRWATQCDDSEPGLSWQVNSHVSSWNMVKLVWLLVLTAARPICIILTFSLVSFIIIMTQKHNKGPIIIETVKCGMQCWTHKGYWGVLIGS